MSHLFLIEGSGCGTARSSQGRVGFARRSGPLMAKMITWWEAAEIIGVADRERLETHGYFGAGRAQRQAQTPSKTAGGRSDNALEDTTERHVARITKLLKLSQ